MLRLNLVLFFCCWLAGCAALMSSQTAKLADNLATAVLNSNDPATVRDGAPAYLLMIDGMIAGDQKNVRLLQAGANLCWGRLRIGCGLVAVLGHEMSRFAASCTSAVAPRRYHHIPALGAEPLSSLLRHRGDLPCPHVHALLTHGLAESKIDQHAGAARTLTKGSCSVMLQNGAHAGPLDLVVRWDSRA